jgi:predicted DNA-binding transcriptional regulator YafY
MTARSRTARQIRATIRAALNAGRALIAAARGRRYRTLTALYTAIDNAAAVRIAYTDEDGVQTMRTIRPERLWISDKGHILCTAWDQLRQDRRTFRTDRLAIAA